MQPTNIINYRNTPLEEEIHTELAELQEEIKLIAKGNASLGLPHLANDTLRTYTEGICFHKHQSLIDKVNRELQNLTTRLHASNINETAQEAQRKILALLPDIQSKLRGVDRELSSLHPSDKFKYLKWVVLGIAGISLFEGILAIPGFMAWGLPLIGSVLAGLLLGVLLCLLTHCLSWIVSQGSTPWKRRAIALAFGVILTLLFYWFAAARVEYLQASLEQEGIHVEYNPFVFTFLSLLCVMTAVALHQKYFPTKEERALKAQYDRLMKEKIALEDQMDDISTGVENIGEQKGIAILTDASKMVLGHSLEKQIITNAMLCYTLYQTVNLQFRKDRPDCIGQPFPFQFQTYFTIHTYHHESTISNHS